MQKLLFVLLVSLSLAGCRLPSSLMTSPSPAGGGAAQQQEQPLTLRGRVTFPRQVQATIKDDVAIAATVSLINTGSNRTEISGVTDDQGSFSLTLPKGYHPDPATTYYLEAIKGLGENKPGHSAARVRTLMKYEGGWVSLSNTEPGNGIVISTLTTAVAVGAALRKGTATPVDFDALIGRVSGQTYSPVTNLSQADVTVLTSLVAARIAADQDPVAGVTLDTGSNAFRPVATSAPEVSTSSVSVAQVGSTVTLTGSGFDLTPGNNVVRVNGTPVTVVSATPTSLVIQILEGATSGQITVQVGALVILGPVLSVVVKVESFSAPSGSAGATLTISGSGFDPSDLSNNLVVFAGGATASVQAATATSLTVKVPAGAVSGPVTVNVLGSEGTSAVPFTVPVVLTSFSPTGGPPGAAITLTGTGFSTTPASNSVMLGGKAATVTAATATTLLVTVPVGATDGPITVTVAGQSSANADPFDVNTGLRPDATIQSIAGVTVPPAGRQANDWNIGSPDAMARDGSGNTYLAASSRIYKVTPAGVISVLAGAETSGYADGPALMAKFSWNLTEMVCDAAGNVYVSDSDNFCIRKIAPNGDVTTVAGVGGQMGTDPDGGLAVATKMHAMGLAVDGVGNLYIGSTGAGGGYAIRKVTASTGIISTFKVTADQPLALLLDGGTLYVIVAGQLLEIAVADGTTQVVAGLFASGGHQDGNGTNAILSSPRSITKDAAGNLYVAEPDNDCVRKIDPAHNVTTYAGMKFSPGYSGDGGLATSAQLSDPFAVLVDAAGDLLISDNQNQRIRKVTTATGMISTVYGTGGAPSGDGGPATQAQLGGVSRMVRDAAGNLYLSSGTRIRKVSAGTGILSTIAGNGVAANTGDGGPAAAAQVSLNSGMAFDAAGDLYVGTSDGGIRKIDMTTGDISLFVATSSLLPTQMAFAPDGNLFVAGGMMAGNSRIWKVTPQGAVSVFAGGGASTAEGALATQASVVRPQALAVDSLGRVYYSDFTLKRLRRIDTLGVVSTVAGNGGTTLTGDGGPAIDAGIGVVTGLALDTFGNIYLSASSLHVVRRIDPSGDISTVAGTGAPGFAGDGGSAQAALINAPTSLQLGAGWTSLYVYDSGNQRIRLVQ